MARNYKPTGRKPGGQKGNTNAATNGVYSEVERAEKMRAHSAIRAARALHEARKLDEAARTMAEARKENDDLHDCDAAWRKIWRDARKLPNFRGVLADVIRNKIAAEWIGFFPDEVAPDWVYAWLDAMPNFHSSPALELDGDVLPGVPEAPWEEEGGEREKPETTPPPIHPRSLWRELFPNHSRFCVVDFDDSVPTRLFELVPQFGSRMHAEAYLRWKMRQLAAHEKRDGKAEVTLHARAVAGGAPYPRNPLPWRQITPEHPGD